MIRADEGDEHTVTEIGSTLGGRYRLLELLGQGGMATIFRARDAQLERDVAVKLLRPEFGKDPDFLARFRDEARAAASLNHPNITAVFDSGDDVSGPYIVMELVDGQDLGAILRENGPLAPRQAARVAAEVAKALHAAHVRGIVHRDVKPSNVLVGRDGRVKVADFGIARALAESQLTMPGVTMGSVHYFSPEQARGEAATAASDIYALGIVLFEALTGQRPFSGDGAAAVALARLTAAPPRPSALRPGVPGPLDAIVLRAMALDPAARYATAAAAANAIEGYLAEPAATGTAAGPAGTGAGATEAGRTVASARARPNPNVPNPNVPYPPDAYARSAPPSAPVSMRGTPPPPPRDDDNGGSGPWAWIAGLLGLVILIVVGFLVFQVLAGGGGGVKPSPGASAAQVTVPRFVDLLLADAEKAAADLGLVIVLAGSEERTDVDPDTVLSQTPREGVVVAEGSEIRLTVARGKGAVTVPDLRGRSEAEARQLLVTEGLAVGTRAEAFDPLIPLGSVLDQEPGPGIIVAPGRPVAYVVSMGPEPTPSSTPLPTPSSTPEPTPSPTPVPTPVPEVSVGDYVCMTLGDAKAAILAASLAVGVVLPGGAPDTYFVQSQLPGPGSAPEGSSVNLGVVEVKPATCP